MPTLYRGHGGKLLAKYSLDADVVAAGRDASCDITLKGGGVSRTHCRFVRSGDTYHVEDLDSANGTYVNGVRVLGKQLLCDGDKIAVMGHILTYGVRDEVIDAPPAAAGGEAGEDYPPTMRVDPDELLRRLEKLFDRPGYRPDDDEEPGGDGSAGDDRA